jgi:tetratricopeptide (TPR) repeat protein
VGECPVDLTGYGISLPQDQSLTAQQTEQAAVQTHHSEPEPLVSANLPDLLLSTPSEDQDQVEHEHTLPNFVQTAVFEPEPELESEPETEPELEKQSELEIEAELELEAQLADLNMPPHPVQAVSSPDDGSSALLLTPQDTLNFDIDSNGGDEESVQVESLEDLSWRRELERASLLLEQDLAAAIKLLERVVDEGRDIADVHQRASSLLTHAKVQRTTRIEDLSKKAHAAWEKSQWELAEDFYNQILALDDKNERARLDLAELVNARLDQKHQEVIVELKHDLRFKKNDVVALGKAVRYAEQLIARGEADDELEGFII